MGSPIHVTAIMAMIRRKRSCHRCGHKNSGTIKFCPYCGKPARSPAEPMVLQPEPAKRQGWLRFLNGLFK